MSHKAHLAHTMPGRIRIKIPAARENPAILDQARHIFDGIPGLHKVALKPDSASIVLHYDLAQAAAFETQLWQRWQATHKTLPHASRKAMQDADLPGDEISHIAHKIEAEAEILASRSHLARAVVDFFKDFDHQVKLLSNNTIDLKIVLALALAAVTFLNVGAHAATPMWITLVLFALNHFLETHPPAIAATAAAHDKGQLRMVAAAA